MELTLSVDDLKVWSAPGAPHRWSDASGPGDNRMMVLNSADESVKFRIRGTRADLRELARELIAQTGGAEGLESDLERTREQLSATLKAFDELQSAGGRLHEDLAVANAEVARLKRLLGGEPYTVTWEAGPCDTCGQTGLMMDGYGGLCECIDCDGSGQQEAGSYTYDPNAPKLPPLDLPQVGVTRGGIRFPAPPV